MNFFQTQEAARRKTSLLILYFLIAVALIVAAVYLAVATILLAAQARTAPHGPPGSLWNPQLFVGVTAGTLLLIFLGSLYKINELRSGGEAVALSLGARPINPNTTDLDERVVLNVVEEMAIASGTPVPPVYVLDKEQGINAFAAGNSPRDAVVTVTRGTMETLTRDELQGVVGHEFSHLLNGDMSLDLRLMGALNGILLIALLGYGVLRSVQFSGGSNDENKNTGAIIIALFALGLSLIAIGYVGVFFGRLIKSAVSRQREYLADASSVQFTRNPGGICGALKKIGGLAKGSRIDNANAEAASHMFFANALRASLFEALATHPPLEDRIKRLDPNFDGTYPDVTRVQHTARDLVRAQLAASKEQHAVSIQARAAAGRAPLVGAAAAAAIGFQPAAAVASVGSPSLEHAAYASALVESLPDGLRDAIRDPLGAVATVYALLINAEPGPQRIQVACLAEQGSAVLQEVQRVLPLVRGLSAEMRLPVVSMTVPAIAHLSAAQYDVFRQTVRRLVEADQTITLFEYALQRMLLGHLAARFRTSPPPGVKFNSLAPLIPDCVGLLSTLAHVGQSDEAEAETAFAAGIRTLGIPDGKVALLSIEQSGYKVVDAALDRLALASPEVKGRAL